MILNKGRSSSYDFKRFKKEEFLKLKIALSKSYLSKRAISVCLIKTIYRLALRVIFRL